MRRPPEPTLAYYRRLSEQEHPDVLPDCVDTLQAAKDKLSERLDTVESYHGLQRLKGRYRLGVTALAASVTVAQMEIFDPILHTGIFVKPAGIGSLIAVGVVGALEVGNKFLRHHVSNHIQNEHDQLTEYHQVAFDRAVEMGVIEPTTE